ncbi:hypothetical protein BDV41DRAFT_577918 [Aspergillus transmontanensis]|uniref:Uncharacterized protein n=1 Tax=Aspergillus transmontanensis TaxID=1034304 RepID=A0A5N6VV23_9EURO|nr:hypothetical protein BDV41DRAFT_577918 [Aspergillus transmontanensis]
MKLFYTLPSALLFVTGLSSPLHTNNDYFPVDLPPPDNWIAGPRIFPSQVLPNGGFHADYDKYNADTWAEYVNSQCENLDGRSTISFAAINSGSSPKCLFWFGYCFGVSSTPDDYKRDINPQNAVQGSRAFTTLGQDETFMRLQRQLN